MGTKKVFSGFVVVSAVIYIIALYLMLWGGSARKMIIMSESMLENYNYRHSINPIPFETITAYITAIAEGSKRGNAIRNLLGNLFLLFPMGFYLPFFLKKTGKLGIYSIIMAVVIIVIEGVQLAIKAGFFDIDDFILNFAGALIGFVVFTRTPARKLLKLRAW